MDADSSTGGLNENSESGELDSLPGDGEYHYNNNSRDSLFSKQSANSERTNIDALDDTARDTIIVPPMDDSSSSASMRRLTSDVKACDDHDLLDFGGDDDAKEEGEEESDDGELQDEESSPVEEPGELSSPRSTLDNHGDGLEDGEVDEICNRSGKKMIKISKLFEREETAEELEEGEVSDDEDRQAKGPVPICRFFGKGQCTWGTNCRFLHPGVIDKGLYTMFDQVRPPPPPIPPVQHLPMSAHMKPGLLGHAPPNFPVPPMMRIEPQLIETPWERAQRQAKELIKQSEKIKEVDIDFEDKKMNLTLTQQDVDKENDYYVKKLPSPGKEPLPDDDTEEINEWDLPSSRRISHPTRIDPDFVRERVHRIKPGRGIRQAPPRDSIREAPPLHEPEVRMVRESSFRRKEPRGHPDTSPSAPSRGHRRSGGAYENAPRRDRERDKKMDEWHDPRERLPREHKKRKDSSLSKRSSYSSGSSKSSRSSSSRSSKSSKSRSKSKSRSRSGSSKSSHGSPRRRIVREDMRKAPPRRPSPKPTRIAPPQSTKDDFFDRRGFGQSYNNRPTRYAPPPPQPPPARPQAVMKDYRMGDKLESGIIVKDRNVRKRLGGEWESRSSSSRSRSRSWSKSPAHLGTKRSKFSRERSRTHSPRRSWSPSSSGSSSRSSARRSLSKVPAIHENEKRGLPPVMVKEKAPPTKVKPEPSEERKPRIKQESQQAKPRVKLTLKPSTGLKVNKSILDKLADDVMGDDDEENSNPPPLNVDKSNRRISVEVESESAARVKQARREEILKQLQKVEEAIAKKRSKIS